MLHAVIQGFSVAVALPCSSQGHLESVLHPRICKKKGAPVGHILTWFGNGTQHFKSSVD